MILEGSTFATWMHDPVGSGPMSHRDSCGRFTCDGFITGPLKVESSSEDTESARNRRAGFQRDELLSGIKDINVDARGLVFVTVSVLCRLSDACEAATPAIDAVLSCSRSARLFVRIGYAPKVSRLILHESHNTKFVKSILYLHLTSGDQGLLMRTILLSFT